MQLNDFQKSKVRFHLGYNSGAQIPAGDRSRLEEAMSLVPDNYFYDQIVYQINRCSIQVKACQKASLVWKRSLVTFHGRFEPLIPSKPMRILTSFIYEKVIALRKHYTWLITNVQKYGPTPMSAVVQNLLWLFLGLLIPLLVLV